MSYYFDPTFDAMGNSNKVLSISKQGLKNNNNSQGILYKKKC